MIDITSVRESYRKMSNAQLIDFTIQEGDHLTQNAIQALTEEFRIRNLNTGVLTAIQDGTLSKYKENLKNTERSVVQQLNLTYLSIALSEKRDNKSNEEIRNMLVETGMNEEDAALLIEQLEKQAHRLYNKASQKIVNAFFICAAAIALYLINPKEGSDGLLLNTLCTVAIVIGLLMITKGVFDKNKYSTILSNIENER